MKSLGAKIVEALRAQFDAPRHKLVVGKPDGGGGTPVYETCEVEDGETLWARFDSSSDAEAVVAAINEACRR